MRYQSKIWIKTKLISTSVYMRVKEFTIIMKEILRIECYRRVRLILWNEIISQNRIRAINSHAIQLLQCCFNISNGTLNNIRWLDSKTRKLHSKLNMHLPKVFADPLYMRRKSLLYLIQRELSYNTTIIGLLT